MIRQLLSRLFAFLLSGVASAVVDLTCFAVLFHWILPHLPLPRLICSVAVARVISCVFNYLVNRNCVFDGNRDGAMDLWSFGLYILLAGGLLAGSYYGTRSAMDLFPEAEPTLLKMTVDVILFLVSFSVQKGFIFSSRRKREDKK
ncbi:MAG: GtrA family protein [Victivallaceae bacterium]|nr:GtrA family protein [Victivallaceae bacterium]